jgi:hypothetical protein
MPIPSSVAAHIGKKFYIVSPRMATRMKAAAVVWLMLGGAISIAATFDFAQNPSELFLCGLLTAVTASIPFLIGWLLDSFRVITDAKDYLFLANSRGSWHIIFKDVVAYQVEPTLVRLQCTSGNLEIPVCAEEALVLRSHLLSYDFQHGGEKPALSTRMEDLVPFPEILIT